MLILNGSQGRRVQGLICFFKKKEIGLLLLQDFLLHAFDVSRGLLAACHMLVKLLTCTCLLCLLKNAF